MGPDTLKARLQKRIHEVTDALDRDVARRCAMRKRIKRVDPEVLLAAVECLGSPEGAAHWLTNPEIGLENRNPLDVADTAAGKEKVLRLLWRLQVGVFADAAVG
jgi:putative toxin-antitoxin system antitoxin component (TIGR02293 family)